MWFQSLQLDELRESMYRDFEERYRASQTSIVPRAANTPTGSHCESAATPDPNEPANPTQDQEEHANPTPDPTPEPEVSFYTI